ncbi:epoxide hydrolase family protein [Oryzifoliimicrobium ureilyticus]|uniref:epoxide hydrolase family protein n=1 Tax=Oryzifoliimicrobium ureilyticus TaxID=3113724 RepID=UPI003075F220
MTTHLKSMRPQPFSVKWSQVDVDDVLEQVRSYPRPVTAESADGWEQGCDPAYMRALRDHWVARYDWRAVVEELNRFPQFTAQVEDMQVHFVHVVGEAGGNGPLLLSYGLPGSHHEFWKLIEPLASPTRYGGRVEDVIIPSLPGFGFSSKPSKPIGPRATARLFNAPMTGILGYDRYLAQGGDWGGWVTSWLGHDYPERVRAIHLNMVIFQPAGGPADDEERAWPKRQIHPCEEYAAYFRIQMMRPQSIAWLAAGNPVGQAAWIAERFHDWSDLTDRAMDDVPPKYALMTNIMLYAMTDSLATVARFYRGFRDEGVFALADGDRCETPTFVINFPRDALYNVPSRSYCDRTYNIFRWWVMERGGHFAALEQPDILLDDIRSFAREADSMKASLL